MSTNDTKSSSCAIPKEVYEDRYTFLAHWYIFDILKESYRAWCHLAMTDAYRKKVQRDMSEIKPNDCKKLYKRYRFDMYKAPNYMYIFECWGF